MGADPLARAAALERGLPILNGLKNRLTNLKGVNMLWTVFVILIIAWLLGVATSYTLGGFVHLLLLVAIAAVLIRIIQGRTPV